MPDLRQLRTFLVVAEERSFTRAARRLHVGQQAVSKTVRALERELGTDLLRRTTHDVHLTDAGRALVEAGTEVLRAAEAAFERTRQVGGALRGTVAVGTTPAIGPRERQGVVEALRRGAADLSVSLHDTRPAEIAPQLRNRTLDLVVARTAAPAPGVAHASLRPSRAVLCVPDGHPLALARPVDVAELHGHRQLTWGPRGTPFTDWMCERLAAGGARVEPVETRVRGLALAELTSANAVAVLPVGWPATDGVTQVEFAEELTLPLVLLWAAGSLSTAVERLRADLGAGPAPRRRP